MKNIGTNAEKNDSETAGDRVGTCALCDTKKVALKNSHSIPQFVFDWLKETSVTPFIRGSDDVNDRRQDGPKQHMLCGSCELRLSILEGVLARRLFKRIANYQRQAPKLVITEEVRVAVLSIFWRVILTSRNNDNDRNADDEKKLQEFLDSLKSQIMLGRCETEIYFTPFFGEPPYYGLPSDMTYGLERMIGAQDVRFFDDPHRFFATFKLPFMYFHVFSEGWPSDEVDNSTPLAAGELEPGKIRDMPNTLRQHIQRIYAQFEQSKPSMLPKEREKIEADFKKSQAITGLHKSMARAAGVSVNEFFGSGKTSR